MFIMMRGWIGMDYSLI
jgi:hypothetical protein